MTRDLALHSFHSSHSSSSSNPVTHPGNRPLDAAGLSRAGFTTALIGALALATGSLWWLLAPDRSPFGPGNTAGMDVPMLAEVLGRDVSQWGTLLLAVAGAVVAFAGRHGAMRTRTALASAAVSLVWLTSASGLSTVGYLLAVAVPAAAVAVVAALVRHSPRLLWGTVPVLAALVAAVATTGFHTVLGDLAGKLGSTMVPLLDGPILLGVSALLMQTGWLVAWAGKAAADVVRRDAAGTAPGGFTAWLLGHRRLVTLLAAGALLPYLLVRLTWLTPLMAVAPDGMGPADRLWGLALGSAAALGIVLTLGLIRPWGERFPRWFPGLGGRPVPVAAALVPGGFVATVATMSAVPMFVQVWEYAGPGTAVMTSLLIPSWFWGPVLGLALWSYAVSRLRGGAAIQPTPGKTYPSS